MLRAHAGGEAVQLGVDAGHALEPADGLGQQLGHTRQLPGTPAREPPRRARRPPAGRRCGAGARGRPQLLELAPRRGTRVDLAQLELQQSDLALALGGELLELLERGLELAGTPEGAGAGARRSA